MVTLFARSVGISMWLAIAVSLAVLVQPMYNELILWGVLSTLSFLVAVSILGGYLALCGKAIAMRLIGITLLVVAACGSQIASTVGACLVLMEFVARAPNSPLLVKWRSIAWRVCVIVAPPASALIVLIVMRFTLGYQDFDSRSIDVGSGSAWEVLSQKFYVLSNAYANLFQAPLAAILSNEIALRAFWPMVVAPPVLLFIALLTCRASLGWALACAALMPTVFFMVAAPLLATSAVPTGFRLLTPIAPMLTCAFLIAAGSIWSKPMFRGICAAGIVAFAVAGMMSTTADNVVRKKAWQRDKEQAVRALQSLAALGNPPLEICRWRYEHPAFKSTAEGILVSYNIQNETRLSVWHTQFLRDFLRSYGMMVSALSLPLASAPCLEKCSMSSAVSSFGPFSLHTSATWPTALICDTR